jgi:hypothetical protein
MSARQKPFERSFASHYRAQFWSNNNEFKPHDVAISSNKKCIFVCNICNHEFKSLLSDIYYKYSWCSYCSNKKLCESQECVYCYKKSFASSDKAQFWSDKNELQPRNVFISSNKIFIFYCIVCNHEFKTSLDKIICKSMWCSFCTEKQLCESQECVSCYKRSFAASDKAQFWSDKNKLQPRNMAISSHKKGIFICANNHEFQLTLNNITNGNNWCPKCATNKGYSKIAIEWLNFIAKLHNIEIQHAENGGEFSIINSRFKADGYCASTNTIFKYHGSMWHGEPRLFKPTDISHFGVSYGDLYQKTLQKEQHIRQQGYSLVVMWELTWIQTRRAIQKIQRAFRAARGAAVI